MSVFIALIALLVVAANVDETKRLVVTMAGIWGIVIYIGVQVLSHLLGGEPEIDEEGNAVTHDSTGAATGVVKAGFGGFLYLEVLDASFSFDGVIGAFAITSDVVIIMLGLAIGAIFVRSMTIYLVEKEHWMLTSTLNMVRIMQLAHWPSSCWQVAQAYIFLK